MELQHLSNFKLQLLALISHTRDLQERERKIREELDISLERQQKTEMELGRKVRDMQIALDARDELVRKLESKIKYIENENMLLERKQKELKDSVDELLHSKESFLNTYKESNLLLQRAIEARDRKITILSDKISSHLSLANSIKREAVELKQTVDRAQVLVTEKEQVGTWTVKVHVVELKEKIMRFSSLEKDIVEKISFLESKLKTCEEECRKKEINTLMLKEKTEAAKDTNILLQMEKLEKALMLKDQTISNLTLDKQALRRELLSMEVILSKMQDTVSNMNLENKDSIFKMLEGNESRSCNGKDNERLHCDISSSKEDNLSDFGREPAENKGHSCDKYDTDPCLSEASSFCPSCVFSISTIICSSPHLHDSATVQECPDKQPEFQMECETSAVKFGIK